MSIIEQKEASVGILVAVEEGALLQVRAGHDSFARACQVTTHGKLNETDLLLDEPLALSSALGRKLRDEIGEAAAEMIEAASSSIVDLDRTINDKGRLIVTKGIDLRGNSSKFRSLIIPGHDVGGFRLCADPSKIEPLTKEFKKSGVNGGEIRMFPDEIKAVKKLFEHFFKLS